jgi:hypothetical protein
VTCSHSATASRGTPSIVRAPRRLSRPRCPSGSGRVYERTRQRARARARDLGASRSPCSARRDRAGARAGQLGRRMPQSVGRSSPSLLKPESRALRPTSLPAAPRLRGRRAQAASGARPRYSGANGGSTATEAEPPPGASRSAGGIWHRDRIRSLVRLRPKPRADLDPSRVDRHRRKAGPFMLPNPPSNE